MTRAVCSGHFNEMAAVNLNFIVCFQGHGQGQGVEERRKGQDHHRELPPNLEGFYPEYLTMMMSHIDI